MPLPSSQPIAIPAGAANRSRGPVESAPQPEWDVRQTHLQSPDPWSLPYETPLEPRALKDHDRPLDERGPSPWQHGRAPRLYEAWLKGP